MCHIPHQAKPWPGPRLGVAAGPAVLAIVLLALGSSAGPPADQPRSGPEGKSDSATVRVALAALLQAALVENERAHVTALEAALALSQGLEKGGQVSPLQVDEVRRELLEARIRLRQREADYDDTLGEGEVRFGLGPDQLKRVAKRTVVPLARHLKRFEEVRDQSDIALKRLEPQEDLAPDKLRDFLLRVFTTDPLVQGTRFRLKVQRAWAAWAGLSEPALKQHLGGLARERRRLLDLKTDLEMHGKELPAAGARRLHDLDFESDVGGLEETLRRYESRPWGKLTKEAMRAQVRINAFRLTARAAQVVVVWARDERFHLIEQTWPPLPPLHLDRVDLLKADAKACLQAVEKRLKPENRLAGRQCIRRLRALAETYPARQELVAIAYKQVQGALGAPVAPPDVAGAVPVTEAGTSLTWRLLAAQRSLTRARDGLYQTWISYQLMRQKLYQELNLAPPEPTFSAPPGSRSPRQSVPLPEQPPTKERPKKG
jgi:hypothetical protein